MRGLFITLEGGDGSGKSTQIRNIERFFAEKGLVVMQTREPGGTIISEKLREILLDTENTEMEAVTEMFIYAAARAQHVREKVIPALERGEIVICDRFVDSSLAYQGFGRELGDAVEVINSYAIGPYMPDVTFLMKLDPNEGKHRIQENRDTQDRLEHEKLAFHRKVYKGYLELEKRYPDRILGIDASRGIDEIRDEIYKKLEEII